MKRVFLAFLLVTASTVVAQQSADELFQQAERRFSSQDYELALDRYSALVRDYPVSQYAPDAQYRIAVSLYRLGRYREALSRLERVEERFRSTRYLWLVPFWKGIVYYQLDDSNEAVFELSKFLDSSGDEGYRSQALLYRALAHLELAEESLAITSLETLVAEVPDPSDQSYALALLLGLYNQADSPQQTIALYERVTLPSIDAEWRDRVALYAAEAYDATGKREEAALLFRELEGAEPEVASIAYRRLFAYAQAGEIDEEPQDVLRRAEQALAGRTDVLESFWLNVGAESYAQERFDLAELYFRRVWEFRQSRQVSGVVPLYLARLLERRDRGAEAEQVLSEYLSLYGEGGSYRDQVMLNLGALRLRRGNPSAAIEPLQGFVDQFPDSSLYPEAAYQLAYAQRAAGRPQRALATVEAEFVSGRAGAANTRLLRLRSRLESELERPESAIQSLFEYLPLAPTDAAARLEYLRLLYEQERYDRVVEVGRQMLQVTGEAPQLGAEVRFQVHYLVGLAYINQERYRLAVEQLTPVVNASVESDSAVGGLIAYAGYYNAWSSFRLGEYSASLSGFGTLVSTYPRHPLAARAAYLGGWSAFRDGQFERSAELLNKVQTYEVGEELAVETAFLLGRVYAAQRNNQAASVQFRSVALEYPQSAYADDAWFEYAESLVRERRPDDAVAALERLYEIYPSSSLAEDAHYRRAELLYGEEQFRAAQQAFFSYRSTYPDGRYTDGALYWGGQARAQLDEGAGALLLWDRLISEFRDSPYRADAMNQAARVYTERGEYREALNLLSEMKAAYPEAARAAEASRCTDELVLLISGLSAREAELLVTIEQNDRSATSAGRAAIIELGRIVIYEATSAEVEPTAVVPMLNEVAELAEQQPTSAAQARFLLAEYYASLENFDRAGNAFLEVPAIDPANGDLAAYALLRAAQSFSAIGRGEQVQALVERLEESFPRSEWITEARRLLPEEE